ncbi:MAG: MFS transporter [Ignavibacteriaceae bacterium]|nr:MFS transporter [Ignavibacteriaceae bacterium]
MKNKSALTLIFLTVFIDLLGFGILIPILPSFAVKVLSVDETAIGIAIAAYSFIQFLFNPILGKYSDKHGRKPVIVACLFINAIGYVIFAFTHSYIMLLFSRIIAGIGGSSIAVAQAYIADVTTKETRAKGMGLIGSAFGLGFVFGPLIGGFLAEYGYMMTGLVAGGFSLLAFIVTMIFLPESLKKSETRADESILTRRKLLDIAALKKVFSEPSRAIFIVLFFILIFSFANIYGTFALLGIQVYGLTDLQNGYLFGITGLVSAIVQGGLIGHIDKMMTKKNILKVSSLIISIGLGLIPYGGNFLGLALISGFLSIGTGMLQPTLLSLISDVTPDHEQGVTLGVNQSLSALARVMGPLWGGFAFEFLGYPFPFLTGAAFMFVVFIFTMFYIPKKIKI